MVDAAARLRVLYRYGLRALVHARVDLRAGRVGLLLFDARDIPGRECDLPTAQKFLQELFAAGMEEEARILSTALADARAREP